MLARAKELQSELNTFLYEEATHYYSAIATQRRGEKDDASLSRSIFERKLPPEDWRQVEDLLRVLQPIFEATKMLEGRPGSSDFCNLGFVIPTFEYIMQQLEDLIKQYRDQPVMRESLNLAWHKANTYYSLLDRSPAYVAAIALDHRLRWSFVEDNWLSHHPNWVERSRRLVRELWDQEYKDSSPPVPETAVVPETILPTSLPTSSRLSPPQRQLSDFRSFITSGIRKSRKKPTRRLDDEYTTWCAEEVDDDDLELNPFTYWSNRTASFPRLSRMALDVLSVPPMSSEAERIFSLAGVLLRERRARLREDITEASELLGDWDRNGLITIGASGFYSSPSSAPSEFSITDDDVGVNDQQDARAPSEAPPLGQTQLHNAYFTQLGASDGG